MLANRPTSKQADSCIDTETDRGRDRHGATGRHVETFGGEQGGQRGTRKHWKQQEQLRLVKHEGGQGP